MTKRALRMGVTLLWGTSSVVAGHVASAHAADAGSRAAASPASGGAVPVPAPSAGAAAGGTEEPFRRAGSPFVGYEDQQPGRTHRIRAADLPPPNATSSADNPPHLVDRPEGAVPQAPAGFRVQLYAGGLSNPRRLTVAPNGDVFVVESKANKITVLRGLTADGKAAQQQTFADRASAKPGGSEGGLPLDKPFGAAFYVDPAQAATPGPHWLYVANTDAVIRFPYRAGDLRARAAPQTLASLPGGGLLRGGGHWTRDLAFSLDGRRMFVSVGSHSNIDDPDDTPAERDRADILSFDVLGKGQRVFASGIRNAVGIAIHPRTGALWASVNERDELGDDLVPDYITSVPEGSFFGWPWFYIGGNPDPRHRGKHPELGPKVRVPDVLLQPHFASLQLTFYEGRQFPPAFRGHIFAAEHGSWNRHKRAGYEVIRVPLGADGKATGDYQDFLTGFVTAKGEVWGRPVGVAVAADGALLVADDGSNSIWRVSYVGDGKAPASPPPARPATTTP